MSNKLQVSWAQREVGLLQRVHFMSEGMNIVQNHEHVFRLEVRMHNVANVV